MAYKFQRGAAVASGSFTAEEGLTSNNALSVTAGTSTLQAVSLSTVTGSGLAQFQSLTVNGGTSTFSSLDVSAGTLTLAAAQITADKIGGGTFGAGTYSFSGRTISDLGSVTTADINGGSIDNVTIGTSTPVTQFTASNSSLGFATATEVSSSGRIRTGANVLAQTLTASLGANLNATVVTTITGSSTATFASMTSNNVTIGGGSINATPIGGTGQAAGQFTTLSASSTLQVGTSATIANGLTVTAGGLTVTAGDSSVQKLTVNGDLVVLGNTFSASVGSLLIEDAAIVIGDGSGPAFQTGYGLLFGSGSNQWASLLTAEANIDGVAGNENVLSSSLPIKAPSFAGTVYGTIAATVTGIGDADATLVTGVNYGTTNLTVPRTWTLPAAPTVGDSVKIKAPANCDTTNYITILKAGSQTIDGENSVVLESNWAAIECVYVATDLWRIF